MFKSPSGLAVVTGASTGIGYELAKCCAEGGFDLIIAADEPQIQRAAADVRARGSDVRAIEVDLSTLEGVDRLVAATGGRPVEALWQMPVAVWDARFSIKISTELALSLKQISPARFT